MLLNEILEKPSSQIRTSSKELLPNRRSFLRTRKWNSAKEGKQARAYQHYPSNTIVKTVHISGPQDPVYQFLRMCLKHQSNPYFPKIFSVKQYPLAEKIPDTKYAYQLVINMERLMPMKADDLNRLGELLELELPRSEWDASRLIQRSFEDKTFRSRMIRATDDTDLIQALRLLEPLFRHYIPDMHTDNIMIRRPDQFVFIDPIAVRGK